MSILFSDNRKKWEEIKKIQSQKPEKTMKQKKSMAILLMAHEKDDCGRLTVHEENLPKSNFLCDFQWPFQSKSNFNLMTTLTILTLYGPIK